MKKIIIVSILMSLCLQAQTTPAPTETKKVMNEVFNSFSDLMDLNYPLEEFIAGKNDEKIKTHLEIIRNAFGKSNHNKTFTQVGFRPSYDTILDYLDLTIESFKSGHKQFAHARISGMPNVCLSCHGQLTDSYSSQFKIRLSKIDSKKFGGDFEYAHFLMALRSTQRAGDLFEKFIQTETKRSKNAREISSGARIDTALRKILAIHTRYSPDIKMAKKVLKRIQKNNEFDKSYQSQLESWITQLQDWEKVPSEMLRPKDDETVHRLINTKLDLIVKNNYSVDDGTFDVALSVGAGAFYYYLNQNPNTDMAPELLYWIALYDRRMNNNLFYAISDLYLTECVKRYPKSPFAKRCYDEYENSLMIGFSGSSGVNLPSEEEKKLKALKKLLQ
jgi:hypothetical protein